MGDKAELCVFCYDISDRRRRTKVSDLLERQAARVQESVFEARLDQKAAALLMDQIRRYLVADDSVRLYRVPDRTLRHCDAYGGPAVNGGAGYWLL